AAEAAAAAAPVEPTMSFFCAEAAAAGGASSEAPADPAPAGSAAAAMPAEVRIRFYSFNMANSGDLRHIGALLGIRGRQDFASILSEPLADARLPDIVSMAMPEIPADERVVEALLAAHRGSRNPQPDGLLAASAISESVEGRENAVRGLIESLAGGYNGDLKTVLAFASSRFEEDKTGDLFGLFTDAMVGPYAVPNPSKAFLGRSLGGRDRGFHGYRFCFVGAHFPISKLSGVLEAEDPSREPLESAKRLCASELRNVLRKARAGSVLACRSTILFVHGDLNSRSMLLGSSLYDIMHEVLSDEVLQDAISHDLGIPPGRWYELDAQDTASALPATYKFRAQPSQQQVEAASRDKRELLRLGDLIEAASCARLFPNAPEISMDAHNPEAYRKVLKDAGDEFLDRWAIKFKEKEFKNYRFPACADRVIYWAPRGLASRISWEFPDGGTKVNHAQGGSDHRPVILEAVLRLAPAPLRSEAERAAEAGSEPPRRAGAAAASAQPGRVGRLSLLLDTQAGGEGDRAGPQAALMRRSMAQGSEDSFPRAGGSSALRGRPPKIEEAPALGSRGGQVLR
ncbi:unnamed protein product, partial [Prorocentrum cordatum]